MSLTTAAAAELHDRASRLVPGGTHSSTRARPGQPFYATRAEGAYLWDLDGQRWTDFGMGNGAVLLGHARPEVTRAVVSSVDDGLTCGTETPAAVQAVETMSRCIPDFGKVRFAVTGTEALMHALAIARHVTGREGVAKAEGAYHGWSDNLWVSTWGAADQIGPRERPRSPAGSAGLSRVTADTVVFPFNDWNATARILRERAAELAAVVVEPVLIDIGFIPADHDYLRRLRELTTELGVLLVFDELLTGFRLGPGGARSWYQVTPDLTAYGKALGNGYPIAAVEGAPDLMSVTDTLAGGPVQWVGTFNGHGASVAAAAASLRLLATGEPQQRLDALTERLRAGCLDLGRRRGVGVVVSGMGGHFQPYFMGAAPRDYRDALNADAILYGHLVQVAERRRVLLPPKPLLHGAISTAHTEADIDELLDIVDEALTSRPQ